jgi:hypothetical protein
VRYSRLLASTLCVLGALTLAGGAFAAKSDTIQVRIDSQATLVGGSIEVTVRIRCAPFGQPLESNITVSQDDQRIFAQRGLPTVPCDRRWHSVTVLATPIEGSFHRGRAFASAFVSRLDPDTSEVRQGQASRTIQVR